MDYSITREIMYTARQSQLCIGVQMEKYGITAAEEPFFMAIQKHIGATQEELTSLVGVDKALTTRVISSLEKKGYLIRRQDEKDRRQNRVYATQKALNIGGMVKAELLQLNDEILRGISKEDRIILYHSLLIMEENLKRLKNQERGESKYEN